MIEKRRNIKFKELIEHDIESAKIFNKAIEIGSPLEVRHYYYKEDFLNCSLSEKTMDWALDGIAIKYLEEEFEKLDNQEPYQTIGEDN